MVQRGRQGGLQSNMLGSLEEKELILRCREERSPCESRREASEETTLQTPWS